MMTHQAARAELLSRQIFALELKIEEHRQEISCLRADLAALFGAEGTPSDSLSVPDPVAPAWTIKDEVLQYIDTKATEPLNAAQVARALGRKHTTVRYQLGILYREGRVARPAHGRYWRISG